MALGADVTPGQQISVVVGAGGAKISKNMFASNANFGGQSTVGDIAIAYYENFDGNICKKGSSGGGGYYVLNRTSSNGRYTFSRGYSGDGGSDGGCGYYSHWLYTSTGTNYDKYNHNHGDVGKTTRYFGESDGTLYAGGGAGCCKDTNGNDITKWEDGHKGTIPGNGGGGATAEDGAANTGGGGGGGNYATGSGAGGSGICIIRWGGYKAT